MAVVMTHDVKVNRAPVWYPKGYLNTYKNNVVREIIKDQGKVYTDSMVRTHIRQNRRYDHTTEITNTDPWNSSRKSANQ